MNWSKKLLKRLDEIKKDCLKLKRAKQLAEYGEGQLDLIKIIGGVLNEQKTKKRS